MNTLRQKKNIGIIGGLGPYAHIEFEKRLLDAASQMTGAKNDQDFPSWILSSLPGTPDRTSAICGDGESPVAEIVKSIKKIEGSDGNTGRADFCVMICNTSHFFFEEIERKVNIPLLNMIDLTTAHIASILPGAAVGIFATTGTLKSRIYHDSLIKNGLIPRSPLDLADGEKLQRDMVMGAIYGKWDGENFKGDGIKSGNLEPFHTQSFNDLAEKMIEHYKTDVFIAGCTEIPLAVPGTAIKNKILIDPMTVTAEAVINIAYGMDEEYNL